MFWVLQSNLYNEYGYKKLLDSMENLSLSYLIVKPVPFTNRLLPLEFDSTIHDFETYPEPDIPNKGKIIAMGSTTLTRIANERKWNPGSYINENFNFRVWYNKFGYNVLNQKSLITTPAKGIPLNILKQLPIHLFIRPLDDSKAFCGMTIKLDKLLTWMDQMALIDEVEFQPMHKNTEILIADAKPIISEYRFFVVDGRVVTGSLYKKGTRVHSDPNVDDKILEFAQGCVDMWQPAKAFVLDIADTHLGPKVIEINNINSSGFYSADCQKIVSALEEMES